MRYTPLFEKFFLEISVLFVPVSKILEFLVHVYTDTEKFRPSLPFSNPRLPARIALNFSPNLFVR